jgi:hypothetical protein
MFAVGFARIVAAIGYFRDSFGVADLTNSMFGDNLWLWGLWDLLIAGVAILAGLSLLGGTAFGRFVTYVWAILVIFQSFLIINVTPWYAVAAITLAVLVIFGLAMGAGWSAVGEQPETTTRPTEILASTSEMPSGAPEIPAGPPAETETGTP